MKKNRVAYWRDGQIFTRCPKCDKEKEGGSWLAAHSMFNDLIATCTFCDHRFKLGKIVPPKGSILGPP